MRRILTLMMAVVVIIVATAGIDTNAANTLRPNVQVTEVTESDVTIGAKATVGFTFKNNGKSPARDFSFGISVPEGSPLISQSTIQNGYEPLVNANTEEVFEFEFSSKNTATAGVYPVYVKGQYSDSDGQNYVLDETIYINLVNDAHRARFELEYNENESLFADANYTKTFTLKNVGDKTADFVVVKFDPEKTTGIKAVDSEPVYLETIFKKSSGEFEYSFYVPSGITGYQEATFLIEYAEGDIHKEERISFFYNVKPQEQNIVVNQVSMSHESVMTDSRFSMSVDVANVSGKDAKDVRVNVVQDSNITVVSDSYQLLNTLEAGETKTVVFEFKGIKDIPTANYPIKVEVVYDDGNKKFEAAGGIYIKNGKSTNSSAPRMSLSQFELSKDQVFVGDDFDLKMTIVNTSTEKSVKNLKVIVDATDATGNTTALIPVGTSNSQFVGSLGIGESAAVEIPYKIIANSKGGMYNLDVKFEYEDSEHNAFKDNEKITLPVYEENKMTLSDVRVGKVLDSGYTLELDFYNTGKIDIHNMMVDIEGDFETMNSNYYVGDFLSGRMDVYSVQLKGALPELVEGKIKFSYDDTFGEAVTMEKEFSIINEVETPAVEDGIESSDMSVMAQGIDSEGNPVEDGNNGGFAVNPLMGAGIVGVIVIAIIGFVVIKRRKKVS